MMMMMIVTCSWSCVLTAR